MVSLPQASQEDFGGQKPTNINDFPGLSREQVGVKNCLCVALVGVKNCLCVAFLSGNKRHKNPQEISGKSWDSPRTIPAKPQDNPIQILFTILAEIITK